MEFLNPRDVAKAIEAILYVYGEPIKIKKIAEILETDSESIAAGLSVLKERLDNESGLDLSLLNDKATLITKPKFGDVVKKIVKEELDTDLTPASLETLAIVAYLGPISRSQIEFIRGVNSSVILRNLLIRGLIQKDSAKDKAGTSIYSITFDFMNHVGISEAAKLPDFEKYRNLMAELSNNVTPEKSVETGVNQ